MHLAAFIVEWLEKTSEKDCPVYEQLEKRTNIICVPGPRNGPIMPVVSIGLFWFFIPMETTMP